MNIYKTCPEVKNERFSLRLAAQQDCEDLLKVYSDTKAVPLFNGDNCNGDDFYYATLERMQQAMSFWIWSYENGCFVRMSIVDQAAGCAVGTIELCYRDSEDTGVLRLDLRSDYEKEAEISEILSLIAEPAYDWVGCSRLITKAKPIAGERIKALTAFGFTPADAPLIGHDGTEYGDYFERVKKRYNVITLCGSTRFKDAFMQAQKKLTLEGNIVISVGLFGHAGDGEVWLDGTKEMLDDMHKRKIDMADEIFVINVGGYIGSSTRSEIEYAHRTGKNVRYLEDELREE